MRHPLEGSACSGEVHMSSAQVKPTVPLQAEPTHPLLPIPMRVAGIGVPVPLPVNDKNACVSTPVHEVSIGTPTAARGSNTRAPRTARGRGNRAPRPVNGAPHSRGNACAPSCSMSHGTHANPAVAAPNSTQPSFDALVQAVAAALGRSGPPSRDTRRSRFFMCRHWQCGEACPHGTSCRFLHGDTAAEAARVRASRVARPFPMRANLS